MTLASRITDLVTAIANAINARAPKVGASIYDLAVINGYTGTQAQYLMDTKARGARAHASAAQSLAANNGNVITIDSVDYNDDSTVFTMANDGITVKVAGLYLVTWEVTMTLNAAGSGSAYVTPNIGASSDNQAGTVAERNGSATLRIAAGTKLQLQQFSSSAGTTSSIGVSANYLAVTRLTG